MDEFFERMRQFHCPRWDEMPDIPLYMDQVLAFLDKRIALFEPPEEGRLITSTMINNYVKQKLIPAPVQKKYEREHLTRLLMICILKGSFSIAEIQSMLNYVLRCYDMQQVYGIFCDCLEEALRCTFGGEDLPVILPMSEEERLTCGIYGIMLAVSSKLYAQRMIRNVSELAREEQESLDKKEERREKPDKKEERREARSAARDKA